MKQEKSTAPATANAASKADGGGASASLAPPAYGIDFLDGGRATGARALEASTRAHLEERLGHGLSAVRLHTGAAAGDSARQLGAHAYTRGNDIVFAPGRYRPDTPAGLRLLTHELVHVVQQARAGTAEAQAAPELATPGDAAEREAERIADGEGEMRPVERPRPGRIHRFEARVHEAGERWGLTQGGAMSNEEASASYFGNWMRDMNQLLVPLVTQMLPPDVLFSMISYMAASKFGRELTPEQFGYYIPSEHIDNPAGLVAADDLLPVQPVIGAQAQPAEPQRLGASRPAALETPQEDVNPRTATVQGAGLFSVDTTGVQAHIRRTNLHIERRLRLAVDAGRNPDGEHHFGAALHAVEDLYAHSNFIEIALDHLLRSDAAFLPQLAEAADRQVFTYSARLPGQGGAPGRAALTTGSFTGADTKISVASEVVGLLSRPLPEPASNEEQEAQDRFMVTLLRTFETRLRNSPELRATVRQALIQSGVPAPLAAGADQMPLADLYQMKTFLRLPIPDWARIPMKRAIRNIVSSQVLQPAAGKMQSQGLEARVADTSLIRVLRDSQRQQAGGFTAAEREAMREQQRIVGTPVAQQEAEARAAGGRRAQAIAATPMHVVAGPSHSQIAKDHPNSPFFGLAFLLEGVAVQRLRDRMLEAWAERAGAATAPFNFDWTNFPGAAPAGTPPGQAAVHEQSRRLYHGGRPARAVRETESLHHADTILATGGEPGQPFDLAVMRAQAATRIRSVAVALRALAGAPGAAGSALDQARELLGHLSPQARQRVARQLDQARAAAATAAASQTVADLNQVAAALETTATTVAAARRHPDREAANAALVQQRQALLEAMARRPALDSGLATALLYTLDEEIQATAVAYSGEQRAVLEGRAGVAEMGPAPAPLTVSPLALPAITGTPALAALLQEARVLFGHPQESSWWHAPVRDYARRFPDRLRNDIEARNEGVPFYRGGAGGGHGHP